MKKNEFKDLLSLATKELHFMFNNALYKHIDVVAMGFPLGLSLANVFLADHEQNWLDSCPLEYRLWYYEHHFADLFLLFKSSEYLKGYQNYLNSCHVNMSFTKETEKKNKVSFKYLSKANF